MASGRRNDCVRKPVEILGMAHCLCHSISTVWLVYAVITSAAGQTQAPVQMHCHSQSQTHSHRHSHRHRHRHSHRHSQVTDTDTDTDTVTDTATTQPQRHSHRHSTGTATATPPQARQWQPILQLSLSVELAVELNPVYIHTAFFCFASFVFKLYFWQPKLPKVTNVIINIKD